LTISDGDTKIKYNVYLWKELFELQFYSTDRSRAELAARLLRLAGVTAEVKKVGGRDVWYIYVYTDTLATGRKELRNAIAEIVKVARENRWIDAGKAEGWLEKLERGRILKEGWPKYKVGLNKSALEVRFSSTSPESIEREAQRFRKMGLKEGVHFSVKMPDEGGGVGYVSILKEGLAYAAWLSENCEDKEQRELAAKFVELILRRAEEADGGRCGKVCEKAKEIVEEGRAWGSLTLNFEKKVEVNGKTYVVKVKGGEAVEEKQNGKTLLRIKIKAEVGRVEGEHIVNPVEREYTITFSRRGRRNAVLGFATARGNTPSDREADAERLAAVIKALTGKEPRIRRRSDGTIEIKCGRAHLEGFKRYAELADAIKEWLEETRR
jgi:hypothetical protein